MEVRIADAAGRDGDVSRLVAVAAQADPGWLPTVDCADPVALAAWFSAKEPWREIVALDPRGEAIGYLALRRGVTPLVARYLDCGERWFELCRAVVHPAHRRRGVLRSLVAAVEHFDELTGGRLWLTCVDDSGAHMAWQRLGFVDAAAVTFPVEVDDRPGRLCVKLSLSGAGRSGR